jgi:hypothetical protein
MHSMYSSFCIMMYRIQLLTYINKWIEAKKSYHYIHTKIHRNMFMCAFLYLDYHWSAGVYMYIFMCLYFVYVCMCMMYVCMCIYVYINIYYCICMHTCTYIYIHTYPTMYLDYRWSAIHSQLARCYDAENISYRPVGKALDRCAYMYIYM